jgi:hypothetical protein
MLAANHDRELAAPRHLRGDPPNLIDDLVHGREREFHLGHREDADAVHIGRGFFVPQLHVRRRHQNLAWTVAGAGDI